MAREQRPAVITLRLSRALRDALHAEAAATGCSLNAFAVQVLAASAGQRARFRGTADTGPTPEEDRSDLRELERRPGGAPEDWKERRRHILAEQDFVKAATAAVGARGANELVRMIERHRPWHFVEWSELNAPMVPDDPIFDDLRAAG
jgi:hypothetical protein